MKFPRILSLVALPALCACLSLCQSAAAQSPCDQDTLVYWFPGQPNQNSLNVSAAIDSFCFSPGSLYDHWECVNSDYPSGWHGTAGDLGARLALSDSFTLTGQPPGNLRTLHVVLEITAAGYTRHVHGYDVVPQGQFTVRLAGGLHQSEWVQAYSPNSTLSFTHTVDITMPVQYGFPFELKWELISGVASGGANLGARLRFDLVGGEQMESCKGLHGVMVQATTWGSIKTMCQ